MFLVANIGLALSTNVEMLIVFRFLQAAGSSSTISIGQLCPSFHPFLPAQTSLEQDLHHKNTNADSALTGAGVIADIAPAEERGGFIGTFAGRESTLSKIPTRDFTQY